MVWLVTDKKQLGDQREPALFVKQSDGTAE